MPRTSASPDCCPPGTAGLPRGSAARARAAEVFRALGDPKRLEVFALIAARPGPVCVCDIVARFDLSQPTISHHLKVLRKARLLTVTKRGTWSYYAVDRKGVASARRTIAAVLPEAASADD